MIEKGPRSAPASSLKKRGGSIVRRRRVNAGAGKKGRSFGGGEVASKRHRHKPNRSVTDGASFGEKKARIFSLGKEEHDLTG